MIVNPGLRRSISGGAAGLLRRADLNLSNLYYSAIPFRGDLTPSMTRATTATCVDSWGRQITALAGEVRFPGARRVRNLAPASEDLTNAGWNAQQVSKAAGAITENSATSTHYLLATGYGVAAGGDLILQFRASLASGTRTVWCGDGTKVAEFNLSTGATATAGGTGITATATLVSAGVYDCVAKFVGTAAANVLIGMANGFGNYTYIGNGTSSINISRIQFENVTGQSVQTAGEYVSVGAPSDWWGSDSITNGTFADGTTGWSGVNNGSISIDTGRLKVTCGASGNGTGEQAITTVVGRKYVVTGVVTCGTSTTSYLVAATSSGAFDLGAGLTTSTTGARVTFEFTATGTTTYIGCRNTAVAGFTAFYDDVVVKPAAYHGSMVDGVKCFPTDLSGNPLTGMTTPLIELQATNVLFSSNTLNAAAWTASGTPAPTQNATGIDGATSAWTLTDDSAVATELILQNKTLTAATWTGSVFVEKTTGAQTSYPIFSVQTGATTTGMAQVTIDTSNGIATPWTAYTGWTGVSCTAKCEDWTTHWRVSVTFTGTAAAWYLVLIPAGTTNATQSTGIYDVAAQGSAVFERAQLELGTAATSYIDNTSAVASVTRNADQPYYTGALCAQIKTLAVRGFKREVGFSNLGVIAALSDGTANNYVELFFNSSATDVRFQGGAAAATQWAQSASNAYTPGQLSNAAQSFATNDIKMAKDGVAQTADTSATIPTVTRLELGMVAGAFHLNGHPGAIYGWTRNLSQSELNAVSA